MKRAICAVLLALLIAMPPCALAQLSVFAPSARLPGQSWVLNATGKRVVRWDVLFNDIVYTIDGDRLELPLVMPDAMADGAAALEIAAVLDNGSVERYEGSVSIGSARDALIAEWIAIIQSENGTIRKSGSTSAPGQCKRYLINTFARAAEQYALSVAPGQPLAMPEMPNPKDDSRVHGCAWTLPSIFNGNPFYLAGRYDFNPAVGTKDNIKAVRAMLETVRPGDVVQLMAVFNNGERGTHTLLVTGGYNNDTDTLYWADSNFRVRVVEGVRYGAVEYNQSRGIDEIAGWLAQASCGASVYRLSNDVALRADTLRNASAAQ